MPGTPRMTRGLLAALGFLAAVPVLATDTYLASFTDISADLAVDPSGVQLTLTAFLIGIGAGQLTLGPVSDRLGRRRVMLAALAVFTLASVTMVFSPGIEVFVALRLLQGFSGAAGVVVSRAIAADLSEGTTAVRALSLIASVVAIGPLIAPPIGGVISSLWGWRGVLAFIAVVAVMMLALAWIAIPESLPAEERHGGGAAAMLSRFGVLVRDLPFTLLSASFAIGFGALMAYIAASPFVGQVVVGMTPVEYSLGFAAGAAAFVVVNVINARVAVRVGPDRMLVAGFVLALLAGISFATLSATDTLVPATFIATAFVLSGGVGLTMSNASALALARASHARGSGAALFGAGQFAVGALVSPLVGLWGEDTATPMVVVMLACSTIALTVGLAGLAAARRR
ncbi:multidrug effflux MFS transporter [Microbacterium thalassium]|uniref:DHA1 family bicyclomycin/chloramphenicol resistance-like MFS transporter n=1 Tax=Microbacterium thalassium TaxID=362649 RepID=A0A7X0FSX5_9MICO|nr:multidrug effflux MFS transporter [Microbacterium thalassium]MBB6392924.1 DHA1 family bicyclomycin/chloramphenicol resistance-like MFS transporter [Microbacterium thalassium]GLK22845.1 Bcr/CflA family drug resistance efflux transporter [Microbacterium thalassium]